LFIKYFNVLKGTRKQTWSEIRHWVLLLVFKVGFPTKPGGFLVMYPGVLHPELLSEFNRYSGSLYLSVTPNVYTKQPV